jgi:site-specific recombinase XerD
VAQSDGSRGKPATTEIEVKCVLVSESTAPSCQKKRHTGLVVEGKNTEDKLKQQSIAWVNSHANVNTAKAYKTYDKQFQQFCRQQGVPSFPAGAGTVAAFLRSLHERNLAKATVNNVACAAIANAYKFAGVPSPTTDPLVRATRKVIAKRSKPEQPKKPLEVWMLKKMAAACKQNDFTNVRDVFLTILLMAAMLRRSEAAALEVDDVWLDTLEDKQTGKQEEVLFIFVAKSKTDQERRGHTIVVGAADDAEICPLRWFRKYAAMRRKTAKALFHNATVSTKMADSTVNTRVKTLLKAIGVAPEQYGSHSGRSGGATAAAAANVEIALIKRHGNWRSDCVYRYIRPNFIALVGVSKRMLSAV